jgi:major membrane immunogen (membrane-anchored lipoprotein)
MRKLGVLPMLALASLLSACSYKENAESLEAEKSAENGRRHFAKSKRLWTAPLFF